MHNYKNARKEYSKNKDLRHGNNMYRACLSKVRYKTETFAQERAKFYSTKYGKPQYVYYCPYCFGYHITSVPRERKGEKE